jgi:hypothetical protein
MTKRKASEQTKAKKPIRTSSVEKSLLPKTDEPIFEFLLEEAHLAGKLGISSVVGPELVDFARKHQLKSIGEQLKLISELIRRWSNILTKNLTYQEWLIDFAMKAELGELVEELLGKFYPEPTDREQATEALIDRWVISGSSSVDGIPVAHLEQCRRFRHAWKCYEHRVDYNISHLLQMIPIRSPLNEWRLVLRGLVAYPNDPDRALDNWRRLNPNRPAASLIQPLFVSIGSVEPNDPSRSESVKGLNPWKQIDATTITPTLKNLQHSKGLQLQIRRLAGTTSFVKIPKHLRLRILRWLAAFIEKEGTPQDFQEFCNLKPRFQDDPVLYRMLGKIMCDKGIPKESEIAWEHYLKCSSFPRMFKKSEFGTAQSLVYEALAGAFANAEPDLGDLFSKLMNGDFDPKIDFKALMNSGTELMQRGATEHLDRLQRAVDLAPHRIRPRLNLIDSLMMRFKTADAVTVARKAINDFPDSAQLLDVMIAISRQTQGHAEELEAIRKLEKLRPGNRQNESRISYLLRAQFRFHLFNHNAAESKQFLDERLQRPISIWSRLAMENAYEQKFNRKNATRNIEETSEIPEDEQLVFLFQVVRELKIANVPPAVYRKPIDRLKELLVATTPISAWQKLIQSAMEDWSTEPPFESDPLSKLMKDTFTKICLPRWPWEQIEIISKSMETHRWSEMLLVFGNFAKKHHQQYEEGRYWILVSYLFTHADPDKIAGVLRQMNSKQRAKRPLTVPQLQHLKQLVMKNAKDEELIRLIDRLIPFGRK